MEWWRSHICVSYTNPIITNHIHNHTYATQRIVISFVSRWSLMWVETNNRVRSELLCRVCHIKFIPGFEVEKKGVYKILICYKQRMVEPCLFFRSLAWFSYAMVRRHWRNISTRTRRSFFYLHDTSLNSTQQRMWCFYVDGAARQCFLSEIKMLTMVTERI